MFHFASGEAFFVGIGLIALALCCEIFKQKRRTRVWAVLLAAFGLLWIILSSTPLDFWLWLVLAVLLVGSVFQGWHSAHSPASDSVPSRSIVVAFVVVWWLSFLGIELPRHLWSPPETGRIERLFVIADSVTAGLNENEVTWPRMLTNRAKIEVVDASQPGATLQSALQQAKLIGKRPGIVLLEIGGNDLLENLPPARFEADLTQLLEAVAIPIGSPSRPVVMFELPLPPASMRYGAIQRRLADDFRVTLIPKRKFIALLTSSGSTVDSIHLSPRGHAAMCDLVIRLFDFPADSGSYVRLERNRIQR